MLPPLSLFFDGVHFWLADGFHRYHACLQAGIERISAEIRTGSRRDAVLYAAGANTAHGLRRSNEDKRRAVSMLLEGPQWDQWSDNAIAKACGVSQPFVATVRAAIFKPLEDRLADTSEQPTPPTTRTVTRNGTTYEQKVKAKPGPTAVPPDLKELPLAGGAADAPTPDTAIDSATAELTPEQIAESHIGELQAEIAALESHMGVLQAENATLRTEMVDIKSDLNVLRAEYDLLLRISLAGDKAALDEVARYKSLDEMTENPFSNTEAIDAKSAFHGEAAQLHAKNDDLYARLQDPRHS